MDHEIQNMRLKTESMTKSIVERKTTWILREKN